MARATAAVLLACLALCATLLPAHAAQPLAAGLIDALVGGRLQMVAYTQAPPNNCSVVNATTSSSFHAYGPIAAGEKTPLFRIVAGTMEAAPRTARNTPLLALEKGANSPAAIKLAKYLPLLNSVSAAAARVFGAWEHEFIVRLESDVRVSGFFATIDMHEGVLTLNEGLLRYLPDEPPMSLVKQYEAMAHDVEQMRASDGMKGFEPLFAASADRIANPETDPVQCFFCFVTKAPMVAIIANILMALLGLRICEACDLADAECNKVILYMVMLVYENLPLLAAIIWQICSDVCAYAVGL